MSSIDGVGNNNSVHTQHSCPHDDGADGGDAEQSRFATVMSGVADGALAGISTLAPILPGGEFVGRAADGLLEIKNGAPDPMPGAADDQLERMFEMQQQNQAFNLQYLELQQQIQEEDRRFSTLSNLMKARHDTAKSAINNMHV